VNVQLLTPDVRGEYLERVQRDIASAEHFVLVTAFATSDGISLLEPAIRKCLESGGQGTLVLALDRQHFNAGDVFAKLAGLVESFPKLEVRIVHERSGLLHAKAVYAKLRDGNATLLVGSANLTQRAFTENHELGLWVDLLGNPDVSRRFQRFAQSLGGARYDAPALRKLATEHGRPTAQRLPPRPPPESGNGTLLPEPLPPPVPVDTFVGDWLQAGSIVGRGRRGLDVLVIRVPAEQLEQLGLIDRKARTKITRETEKTLSAGYGVRLLPDDEDERIRKDARRTRGILAKLTLNLPCFGLWMPRSYWPLFQETAAKVQADGISAEAILEAAERRRLELDGVGTERQVDAIVSDLTQSGLAKLDRKADLRAALIAYFRAQLHQRTPDLIARAAGFRTQRQALASDLDLQVVARSFFVDLIQATFAATYRSGGWPRRFRSGVGRQIAARIEERLGQTEGLYEDLALQLLDFAAAWEDDRKDFDTVTAEVNGLIGEADEFAVLSVEELLQTDPEGGDDGDDD
jgi:HKD family nuclease